MTRLRHAVSMQVNKVPDTASLGNGRKITFIFESGVSLGHQEINNQKIVTPTMFRLVRGCRILELTVWWPFQFVHADNAEPPTL